MSVNRQPNPADWDFNFPAGWKSTDLAAATDRVFTRIPGTPLPSRDGRLYLDQGFNVLAGGLSSAGWAQVSGNAVPELKNRTFAHTEYMFLNGERGGVLATYMASVLARSGDVFDLWSDTSADRIIRDGGRALGLQVSCTAGSGFVGVANLTPGTGRIVLSAGAFGTPKLLFRSEVLSRSKSV